jgi:hypothetical protein
MRQNLKFYLFCLLTSFTLLISCQSKPEDKPQPVNVFIFLSPECPLSQSYVLTINELSKQYKKNDISFYGVFSGKLYTKEQISDFQKKFEVEFPLSRDTDYVLTRRLNATVTPQAFVVDDKNNVLYSGRIDNWAYEVSKKRKLITEHNLQDALESIINHTDIRVKKTEAVGCFIETASQ